MIDLPYNDAVEYYFFFTRRILQQMSRFDPSLDCAFL